MVWTNDKNHKLHNMLGTDEKFILTDFNENKMGI